MGRRNRIESTRMQRRAFEQPDQSETAAADCAVFLQRLDCIMGAGRREPTPTRWPKYDGQNRRNDSLVDAYNRDKGPSREKAKKGGDHGVKSTSAMTTAGRLLQTFPRARRWARSWRPFVRSATDRTPAARSADYGERFREADVSRGYARRRDRLRPWRRRRRDVLALATTKLLGANPRAEAHGASTKA